MFSHWPLSSKGTALPTHMMPFLPVPKISQNKNLVRSLYVLHLSSSHESLWSIDRKLHTVPLLTRILSCWSPLTFVGDCWRNILSLFNILTDVLWQTQSLQSGPAFHARWTQKAVPSVWRLGRSPGTCVQVRGLRGAFLDDSPILLVEPGSLVLNPELTNLPRLTGQWVNSGDSPVSPPQRWDYIGGRD